MLFIKSQNRIWMDATPIAIGQLICVVVVCALYVMLGQFDWMVPAGALAGALLATVNYLLLYSFANKAADKAEQQDVAGGQKLLQLSYMGRMIGLLVALVVLAKSGWCNVIALTIPLGLNQPIVSFYNLVRKKGGTKK